MGGVWRWGWGGGVGHGDLDGLLAQGFGFADFAAAGFIRHLDHGVVDGAGGGFLTEGGDVARGVADVGDVGVDEVETDFVEFDVDAAGDAADEFFSVSVDFFNGQRGDDDAHLAHDDFRGQVADVLPRAAEQAAGGVLHDFRLGADAHDEGGGDVDADVLAGERTLERHVDVERVEIHVGVVLDDGHHEGGAAVQTLGRAPGAHLAVDNEDFV